MEGLNRLELGLEKREHGGTTLGRAAVINVDVAEEGTAAAGSVMVIDEGGDGCGVREMRPPMMVIREGERGGGVWSFGRRTGLSARARRIWN
ncbi:hypothetical protein M0R45_027013 [Rubus argutus]|uniref:Uncharacterized protein n=1 Tax=Rubus argutus TaxID=59490 RepID=A0AAW1WZ40_RUBAR